MNVITFVNVSHPTEIKNRNIQTSIRRHVMRDIGRSRRKKASIKVVPLEVKTHQDELGTKETRNVTMERLIFSNEAYTYDFYRSPRGSGILGLELDENALQVVEFMIAQSHYKYRPFHVVWLRIGLSDPTAFQLSLASALLFKDSVSSGRVLDFIDNEESAKHYFRALNQLSSRLSDRTECLKPGVIATVLGCICHDTIIGNWERWTVHTAGMMRMYNLRGGFDGMENQIPLMAFWLDLVGAAALDLAPRLPIPIYQKGAEVGSLPLAMQELVSELEQTYPDLLAILQAFQMVSSVADFVNHEGSSTKFWKDEVQAIHLIGPVTHHLLSIPRPSATVILEPCASLVGEMVRLACLMLLSGLKKKFSLNALDMLPFQAKLANVVTRFPGVLDLQLEPLARWAIITAALLQQRDTRAHLLPYIHGMSINGGFSSAQAAIKFNRSLLWVSTLEDDEEFRLAEEVENYWEKH